MVDVRPFRGLEFDPKKVELGKVVAPPFDVINEDQAEQLRKHPHNLVHLTLPQPGKKTKDPYEQAHQRLSEWLAGGVLRETPEDALYAYEIWYRHRHQEKRQRGVVVALKVDPTYKQVIPHERIFDKPAEDRLKLLRATSVDLEPIWLLYSGRSVEETLWAYIDGAGSPPDLLVTGPDGAIHKLWRVADTAVADTVVEGLKGRKAYIADGHHRYATAVKYAEERRLREYRPSKTAPYEYKMVLLVNMSDPGLAIHPTHRVVKTPKRIEPAAFRAKLEADFTIEDRTLTSTSIGDEIMTALEAAAAPNTHYFGVFLGGKDWWLLRAKTPVLPEDVAPGRSFTWRNLDVAYLQKLIVERHLGIPEAKWGDDLYYTRSEAEAVQWVAKGKAPAALFHVATKLPQLRAIADGGEHMPQKSTFFAPKPLSGLVMRSIGRPETVEPPKRRITS